MDGAEQFLGKQKQAPISSDALRSTVRLRVASLLCALLISTSFTSATQADSDHVQQSVELMNAGDLIGAEKEAG
jgi:hypothetical protein